MNNSLIDNRCKRQNGIFHILKIVNILNFPQSVQSDSTTTKKSLRWNMTPIHIHLLLSSVRRIKSKALKTVEKV